MRLLNLQALRGVACLLVVFFHIAGWSVYKGFFVPHPVLRPFDYFGFAGVDLFFVLSGFVITWVHADVLGDRTRLVGYLGKRIRRIYPVYWVCWCATALAFGFGLGHRWELSPREVARFLLLLPTEHINGYVPQAWSLIYEVAFYVAFAGFFLLPRRAFVPLLGVWFLAVVADIATGAAAASLIPYGPAARGVGRLLHPFVLEFLLGCGALSLAVRAGWIGWGRACMAGGVAGFAAGGFMQYAGLADLLNPVSRVLQFGVSSTLIVYGAVAAERSRGWVLPTWLQTVGDASYPIYLVHIAVFELVHQRLAGFRHDLPKHLLWINLMVLPALAIGFLVHFAVERPLLRSGRRVRPARTPVSVEPAPADDLRRAA